MREAGGVRADRVLAVVVSYNGADSIAGAVGALRGQSIPVLVVDNGSDGPTHQVLQDLARDAGVAVIRWAENRGVGAALNEGIREARRRHADWLLTMDQDSVIADGYLEAFADAVWQDATRACLAPAIESVTGADPDGPAPVAYAITSGTLVRLDLFDAVGDYDEGFFVDGIDFDFSLRVRGAGHRITRVPAARLGHQLGQAVALPRAFRRVYAQHGAVRRYYIARNFLYLASRFVTRFPWFVIKLGVALAIQAVLIAFLDPLPLRNYRAMAAGVRDFLRGRHGAAPTLP